VDVSGGEIGGLEGGEPAGGVFAGLRAREEVEGVGVWGEGGEGVGDGGDVALLDVGEVRGRAGPAAVRLFVVYEGRSKARYKNTWIEKRDVTLG
jgi:hypothetical protein